MLLTLKPKMGRWVDQMIICSVLSVGMGFQITLYCTEVVARIYCPEEREGSWLFGLRMLECYRRFNP